MVARRIGEGVGTDQVCEHVRFYVILRHAAP
jgi:hypothetical protein